MDEKIHLTVDTTWLIDLIRNQVWYNNMPFSKGINLLTEGISGITKSAAVRILTGAETIVDQNLVSDTKEAEYLKYQAREEKKNLTTEIALDIELFPYKYLDKFAVKRSCEHFESLMADKPITYIDIKDYFFVKEDTLFNNGLYSISRDFVLKPINSEADQEEFYEYLYDYWDEYLEHHDLDDETKNRIQVRQFVYNQYKTKAKKREAWLNRILEDHGKNSNKQEKDFQLYTGLESSGRYLPTTKYTKYGLISPAGEFYACDFGLHAAAASYLLNQLSIMTIFDDDAAKELLYQKGWIFVNSGKLVPEAETFLSKFNNVFEEARKAQIATMYSWLKTFKE